MDAESSYVTCKAGSTKNRDFARQYIQPELAAVLRALVATKPVFSMPDRMVVAEMLRADLSEARRMWLKDSWNDPDERMRREQSDFLLATDQEGEHLDFHSLRHTCGAWMAMTGAHPKVVQTVMRHGSTTLTMDTYGHLFPGQEADAIAGMRVMLTGPPTTLRAAGTDDEAAAKAQHKAQQSGRETWPTRATGCDKQKADQKRRADQTPSPKPLQIADLSDGVRSGAIENESSRSGGRTRTTRKGHRILSLRRLYTTLQSATESRRFRGSCWSELSV